MSINYKRKFLEQKSKAKHYEALLKTEREEVDELQNTINRYKVHVEITDSDLHERTNMVWILIIAFIVALLV